MSDTDRILQILEAMQSDLSHVKTDVSGLKTDVSGLKTDVSGLKTDMTVVKDILSHTNTVVKVLPTKRDLEVTVEAAKSELKADLIRKIQRMSAGLKTSKTKQGLRTPKRIKPSSRTIHSE
jgi:hypothetical protein